LSLALVPLLNRKRKKEKGKCIKKSRTKKRKKIRSACILLCPLCLVYVACLLELVLGTRLGQQH